MESDEVNLFKITNTNHKNLDGIRAIGILMVIAQHFYGELINLKVLWISIDLLFALSGLLITGILIETKEDKNYFKKFYLRRILRIFPLYYLLIIIFSIYIFVITNHPEIFEQFKSNIFYYLTYTQNWLFLKTGMPEPVHLNHTWSLAIDEQIYLFWPFLIWFLKKPKNLTLLCFITLIASLFFRFFYNLEMENTGSPHPFPFFHNTLCRLDSFAAGSLLFCLLKYHNNYLSNKKVLILFIFTILAFILFGVIDKSFERGGYFMRNFGMTIIALHFCTWLFFAVKNISPILNIIFSNYILVYIGKISYSLYVFHWFLLILLLPKINMLVENILGHKSSYLAITLCLLFTFFISALSYEYFEKPFIKLKKKFSYK